MEKFRNSKTILEKMDRRARACLLFFLRDMQVDIFKYRQVTASFV